VALDQMALDGEDIVYSSDREKKDSQKFLQHAQYKWRTPYVSTS
jgi:hypothetical protein